MKTCLLAITGSVAAMKTPEIVRQLQRHGCDVHCILTAAGREFVTPAALAAISGNPVYDNAFFSGKPPAGVLAETKYPHLEAAKQADVVLVAPASADTIARLATGRADGVFEAAVLAAKCPVLVAPAMNTGMWDAKPTRRNIDILRNDGIQILPVEDGKLACGDVGAGRMLCPELIGHFVKRALTKPELTGKKVLVTLGRTEEPLDPVRVISNRSSGKTGIALALQAFYAGAEVTTVAGKTSIPVPEVFAEAVSVRTAEEMLAATQERIAHTDIAFFVAAVSDFAPLAYSTGKMTSARSNEVEPLRLKKTPDIAATLGKEKRKTQRFYGFSLETSGIREGKEIAQRKLRTKNLDGIFLNFSSNLDADSGRYYYLDGESGGMKEIEGEKAATAEKMIKIIAKHKIF